MESILIKDLQIVVTQDEKRRILRNVDIYVEDGVISKIGEVKGSADIVLNGKGKAAIPGLINTHTHIPMNLFRGVADDMRLFEWLNEKIWPMERKLTPDHVEKGALLGMLEALKTGTTTIFDMYFFEDRIAEAAERIGIRALLSSSIIDGETPETKNWKEALNVAENFVKKWKGRSKRIIPSFGPHAPYTVGPEAMEATAEAASKYNVPVHIHLSEDSREVEQIRQAYGVRPIEYAEMHKILDLRTIAAHVVWPSDEEIEILRRKRVLVSHNPVSNMKTSAGIAPIPKMISHGVIVGLGTDGAASNNILDMPETMKLTALIHKVANRDPTVVKAQDVVDMATVNPAMAMNLGTGSIEVGKKADIVIIDLKKPWWRPIHSPISHLVYSFRSTDVVHVIVDGKIVIEEGHLRTMDENEIMDNAERAAIDLLERAGIESFLSR
ncbi:MAG: N-ethylammeline chlorohydrolase [Thermoproteota archaeon]|nr:MAG: N-ethylammeline chlorohydrolase [Candidatus Korarchaeota archaeon]